MIPFTGLPSNAREARWFSTAQMRLAAASSFRRHRILHGDAASAALSAIVPWTENPGSLVCQKKLSAVRDFRTALRRQDANLFTVACRLIGRNG